MSLTTQRGSRSTQKQTPRAGRAEHEPVRSLGEILLRQRVAEHLVVDAEIVLDDAALGDAGGTAGLENISRLILQGFRHPTAHRAAAQAFVLEEAEQLQVVEPPHVLERVERKGLGAFEPER